MRVGFSHSPIEHEGLTCLCHDYQEMRLIPSDLIRDASVVDFMPSNCAAPLGPETLPFAALSAARILSASSWRIWASVRTLAKSMAEASEAGTARTGDGSSTFSLLPVDVMTARSMTCCNSRTFPGQSYC